jgi:hypothetical protein
MHIPATFGAVLFIYTLSIGPAFRLWPPYTSAGEKVGRFYSPLDWVCSSSPPLEQALLSYVKWWLPPQPVKGWVY